MAEPTQVTSSPAIPLRLNLKRDEKLDIAWADGKQSSYSISLLRTRCPCAQCRIVRDEQAGKKKPLLQILPGNYSQPLSAVSAELVGNYALRIHWSDNHDSGIYSFEYLREIADATPSPKP